MFAFFALSTITALLVRVLISSGVVVLFPIFWFVEALGFRNLLNTHVMAVTYPWLGIPLEILEGARVSTVPFILGHLTRVIIFYVLYQCAQIYLTMILYNRMFPGGNELWLYAQMLIWEYYSMLYVRSLATIRLFPRLCFGSFLIYHFYRYTYPSGFHGLALFLLFCFNCWAMAYCVQKFELVAFNRGDVNFDRPRALVNHLPWPAWSAALPPEYTIFQPVSERTMGVYQAEVPPLNGVGPQAAEGVEVEAPTIWRRIVGFGEQLVRGAAGYQRVGVEQAPGGGIPAGGERQQHGNHEEGARAAEEGHAGRP